MLRTLRNSWRLLQLARSLARHDALFPLRIIGAPAWSLALARPFVRRDPSRREGQRLAAALTEMGPSFIKFGQALSTRADLLSEQIAADLSSLQDHLEPFPGEEARAEIERAFGKPVSALYARFEDRPVAAASISQVHYAVDAEGRDVAVKVLRPGIEAAFARDLDLFYWLAEIAETARPQFRRLRPVDSVRAFAEVVRQEMDLRLEAAACEELGANFEDDPGYRTPRVDWERTAQRVLTTERIVGVKIDDRAGIAASGHDVNAILKKSAEAFFYQVFRDGFFHGDMHGGNAFVDAQGVVIPVDFGIMGRVDPQTRGYLAELLIAFLRRDYRAVAEVQFRAGYVAPDKSLEAFAQACRSIGEPIFGKPSNAISIARLLAQLLRVTEQFEMEVQPQLLLLQKTMLMAEGMGVTLNPDVNIWELARPLIEDWMREHFGPRAQIDRALQDTLEGVRRLPRLIDTLEQVAERERRRVEAEVARRRSQRGPSLRIDWPMAGAILALLVAAVALLK